MTRDYVSVSVMIFTLNEEMNIGACLESVTWSDDIIVVDSGSSDKTRELSARPCVRFFENKFLGFGTQRNWALRNTSPKYDWVLILDADERVPQGLAEEIGRKIADADKSVAAFRLRRRFMIWGRWLKYSNLYPTWVVRLVHKERVRYVDRGHAETQELTGEVLSLGNDLIDENNKGIEAWFERQNRYSGQEALYELEQAAQPAGFKQAFSSDPLKRRAGLRRLTRSIPGRPIWYFLYSYVIRGGFLEGRDGFMFCSMRAVYQAMIGIKKYDLRRRNVAQ
ncbi:glycosyltransferase family 2 protein [Pseudomonadota bacterium]